MDGEVSSACGICVAKSEGKNFLIKRRAMKTYEGGGIAAPFLTSVPDGDEWPASRHDRFYCRGERPRYPLGRRLGGAQSQSRRCGEEKEEKIPLRKCIIEKHVGGVPICLTQNRDQWWALQDPVLNLRVT
jgi:hypothetical protein